MGAIFLRAKQILEERVLEGTMVRMRQVLFLLTMVCFCGMGRAEAPIERMYVFGDSYSDIGRGWVDSDGPTAVAYLANHLGITLVPSNTPDAAENSLNFAVSGASTGESAGRAVHKGWLGIGMKNQVAKFVAMVGDGSITFDPQTTIFFIAGGLNDKRIPTEQTVANIESEIESLYAVGARRFRIAILPEKIPAFSEVGKRLNPAIEKIPEQMQPKLKGAGVRLSQWGAFFDEVMDHPEKYGITDITNPCAGREIFDEDATPCASPASHFYYHKGHPSTAVHKVVGKMLYAEITGAKSGHPVTAKPMQTVKDVSDSKPAVQIPSSKAAH